ncbi:hypothetical protein IT882_06845 [Microbacterium schleiferi]|uniref:HNH domain-containing protein n=1 Tax=Microbacterium schleiferi TaxID=69362 RepID=A0A7S8MZY5_9MICO|nr:HNH endonuclease [Microbacterium schleiferi]QPE05695.1 hypothetical protein IT882_06845 [Microbacterium schleiferi]
MTLIDSVSDDAVDLYADILEDVAHLLAKKDVEDARASLAPIAGEQWAVRVPTTRTVTAGTRTADARRVSARSRAEALIRDRFRCSRCGGRGVPRCVLVAISDVFPEEFPYDRHYGRGRIHPAYWLLVLEADHTLAFAKGGADDVTNLTAMHALCNTQKADALLDELSLRNPLPERPGWDGLLTAYPGIVQAGEEVGSRHASPRYHVDWMRRFGLSPVG